MKSLLKYEILKILRKRLSILALTAVLLFSVLLSVTDYRDMHAYDGVSREGSGGTAVEIEKDLAAKYGGILTDEKVRQILTDFKPGDLHGLNPKYYYQNAMQAAAFNYFVDLNGSWNGLSVSDVFGNEVIKAGYIGGWSAASQSLAKVLLMLSMVLILLTTPVFSGEYGGMDNLIFTSRYGRTKDPLCKVSASMIVSAAATVFTVAFHLLTARLLYGTEGLDCSILFAPAELTEGYIPFNFTCGEVLQYQVFLSLMGAVSVTGITLLLSAACKNQMAAFIASAALYILPVMLPIPETSPLYRIIVLMPLYDSQYISLLSVGQLKNGMLYAVWSVPAALLLLLLGSIASPCIFARRQVS